MGWLFPLNLYLRIWTFDLAGTLFVPFLGRNNLTIVTTQPTLSF